MPADKAEPEAEIFHHTRRNEALRPAHSVGAHKLTQQLRCRLEIDFRIEAALFMLSIKRHIHNIFIRDAQPQLRFRLLFFHLTASAQREKLGIGKAHEQRKAEIFSVSRDEKSRLKALSLCPELCL